MNYFLFKLQFDTAVHFGGSDSALSLYTSEETLRADTLFSALCHETLVQQGEAALERLCESVRPGQAPVQRYDAVVRQNVLSAQTHRCIGIHRGGGDHPAQKG